MAKDTTRTPTARKAPARKAPALTATPAPARRRARPAATPAAVLEGVVVGKATTEALTAAEAPAAKVDKRPTVTLKGRVMPVKLPSAEQIDIILETYDELGSLSQVEVDALSEEAETQANERARRLLRRARIGAMTVLADEADREWVTDETLRDNITLNDVAALLPQVIAKLVPARKAPTTGPKPKAQRR